MEFARLWIIFPVLSLGSALAFPLAALGTRAGLWGHRAGFLLFAIAWVAGFAALAGCAAGLFKLDGTPRTLSLAGALLSLALTAGPLLLVLKASKLPPINDISTDTSNPPEFSALLPLRAGAETPADYPGAKAAGRQRAAYPRVVPKILPISPPEAYRRALERARSLGWNVVGENEGAGRFEAWERTSWFGFTDDVAVRVTPDPSGARVDVRSHSRVGKADMGANARRIEKFLDGL